jgi:hypothetical protein
MPEGYIRPKKPKKPKKADVKQVKKTSTSKKRKTLSRDTEVNVKFDSKNKRRRLVK